MKIREAKLLQDKRLNEIAIERGIDYESLRLLLESVKTKKLIKRNNYHQQSINEIIEKAIK
jgi:hypothetical protein